MPRKNRKAGPVGSALSGFGSHSECGPPSVGPYWFVQDGSGRVLLIAHCCALDDAEKIHWVGVFRRPRRPGCR
jgi:hypothetical protein